MTSEKGRELIDGTYLRCKHCARLFMPESTKQDYCTPEHTRLARDKRKRERYAAERRAA